MGRQISIEVVVGNGPGSISSVAFSVLICRQGVKDLLFRGSRRWPLFSAGSDHDIDVTACIREE